MKLLHLFFGLSLLSLPGISQETIDEAKVQFILPEKWSLAQKAGTFEDGLIQYFFYREPVFTTEGNEAHPAVIFILDKINGRDFTDFVTKDLNYEKNGRLSKGDFSSINEATINGLKTKSVEINIDDSGFKLRTLIYYFFNNEVAVKLILNTIREPNPATAEQEAIINSLNPK